jgi:hypothetical protein
MGTIKIELDLPNFEKEIELKVIINKDGVQSCTPPIAINTDKSSNTPQWRPSPSDASNILPTSVSISPDKSNANTVSRPVQVTTTAYNNSQNKDIPSPQSNGKIPSSMMGTY